LELIQIDIEGTIETERSRNGGDNLCNESVKVGERWRLDVEVLLADVIDSLVINLRVEIGKPFNQSKRNNIP